MFPSPIAPSPAPANGRSTPSRAALVALGLGLCAPWASAEKADRTKPLTMESDRPCTVDLVRQVSVCTGNVVIAQGTLVIRADRVELRETPEGYRTATAHGTPGKPAVYRQKRDGGRRQVDLADIPGQVDHDPHLLLSLDVALTQLAAEDPAKAELVRLRFYAGLTLEQAERAMGLAPATADRWWAYSRAWLYARVAG